MTTTPRENYRIGVDILGDGRAKAKARGTKSNTRTFPAGTTAEQAATFLAARLEGFDFSHVSMHSGSAEWKSDWTVYVETA